MLRRGRTLFFAVLGLPICLGLREAVEEETERVPDRCGGLWCVRTPEQGRPNQGRFQLRGGAAKRISWRLLPEASYTLQRDHLCAGQAETLVSSVQVVPWVHADDPINGSTIELYVPALKDLDLRMTGAQDVFLCASKTFQQEQSCLCQLDLSQPPYVGLLARLGRWLPGKGFAEVQVSLDRQCPARWIPDAVAATVLILLCVFLLLVVEAVLASRRAGETENPRSAAEEAGLVVSGPLTLMKKGGTGAFGFVTLMTTTQSIAVSKALEAQVPEVVIWLLILSAGLLSSFAVWRSFQSMCQIQLSEAYLLNGHCVRNTPSVRYMDYGLAAGVMLYALTSAGGMLWAGLSGQKFGYMVLVITALVGPVINLLLRVKARADAENNAAKVGFRPGGVEAILNPLTEGSTQGPMLTWAFLQWEEVLQAGREGREVHAEAAAECHGQGAPFGLVRDVVWQRQRILKLTSSRAGFMVWPGCFCSLALALASTALQSMLFVCSRGELETLQVSGLGTNLDFSASQDHYVLSADQVVRQLTLLASAPEARSTRVTVSPPLTENTYSVLSPVPIGGMPVPRVANVTVKGLYPGLRSTQYFVRFAPEAKLAKVLLLEDAKLGFKRCLAWATLPGSQLSVPPQSKFLNATIIFADYVLGVPLAKDQAEQLGVAGGATWTVFYPRKNASTCKPDCLDDPDCLASFEGRAGCFAAYHNYSWHERQGCGGMATSESEVQSSFRAQMFGCETNSTASGAECGLDVQVQGQTARFGSVLPDWQGGIFGQLRLKLRREQSLERKPAAFQAISLYRNIPLATDVLVKLIASSSNTTEVLRVGGKVSPEGDVIVTVSRFDPFRFDTLRLIVVPILPDTNFRVRWASIPNDGGRMEDADLPDLKRCNQSNYLRQRYRACRASQVTARPSEPVNFTFSPWAAPPVGSFFVEPRDREERLADLWPRRQHHHRLEVHFDGADSPGAWAAEEHGCALLQRVQRSRLNLLGRSADTFCTMVDRALASGQCDYSVLCNAWGTALEEHTHLSTLKVARLLACQVKAQKLPWPPYPDDCPWLNFSAWGLSVAELNQDTLRRRVALPASAYESVLSIKIPDFFENVASLEDLRSAGLAAAAALCQHQPWGKAAFSWDRVVPGVIQRGSETRVQGLSIAMRTVKTTWMSWAIRTGSADLTTAIYQCLLQEHRKSLFGHGHVVMDIDASSIALAGDAWDAVTKMSGQFGFDPLSWLLEVGGLSPKMPQALVTAALQHGSNTTGFHEKMEELLPSWNFSCKELVPSLPSRIELDDLGWVLQRHPCDQVSVLNISGSRFEDSMFPSDSGFFEALLRLERLVVLSIKHWSLTEEDMALLSTALAGRTLTLLELLPRMGEPPFPRSAVKYLPSSCVQRLELGDLGFRSTEEVDEFISEVVRARWPCLQSLHMEMAGLSNFTLLLEMQPAIEEAVREAANNSNATFVISKD